MFKKLVCLAVVLALAGVASAAVDVVVGGVIQAPWVSGGTGGGNNPFVDGATCSVAPGGWGAWTSVQSYSAMTSSGAGNNILELDIRLDTDGQGGYTADEIGAFHILINPTNRWDWEYKWEGASMCSIDGGAWTSFSAAGPNGRPIIPLDTGLHNFRLDLETNIAGGGPGGVWPVGASVHDILMVVQGGDGGFNATIDSMAFTPEPATLALLGLGGLALIRKRR